MALRIARGLFRLWLVLSVLWIVAVGTMTWSQFPAGGLSDADVGLSTSPGVPKFDPSKPSTPVIPKSGGGPISFEEAVRLRSPDGLLSYEEAVRLQEAFRRSPGGISYEEAVAPAFDPSKPSTPKLLSDWEVGIRPPACDGIESEAECMRLLKMLKAVKVVRNGAEWGVLPSALVLVVGSSLLWAFRGFRQ
jgi:hypothetical protein